MRLLMALLVTIWLAASAAGADDKPAEKSGSKSSASKEGVSPVEKKTPFGTAKYQDKTGEDKQKEEPPSNLRAYDQGDTVRFERKTPFGVSKWTKKKSELDDTERAALEREQQAQAGKQKDVK